VANLHPGRNPINVAAIQSPEAFCVLLQFLCLDDQDHRKTAGAGVNIHSATRKGTDLAPVVEMT
jgi:hypothetical protein